MCMFTGDVSVDNGCNGGGSNEGREVLEQFNARNVQPDKHFRIARRLMHNACDVSENVFLTLGRPSNIFDAVFGRINYFAWSFFSCKYVCPTWISIHRCGRILMINIMFLGGVDII